MKFLKALKNKKEQGNTLTEVLVGVAIIGITTVTTASQNGQLSQTYMRTKATFSYQAVASEIVGVASQFALSRYSFDGSGSAAILNCMRETNTTDCHDRSALAAIPMNLYKPNTTPLTRLAGTRNDPVMYDGNGKPCTVAGKCAFRAYTEVSPRCYKGNRCKVAHTMMLTYTVEPISNAEHWISAKLAPKPIIFETALETNLVSIVNEINTISCNLSRSQRQILKGLSLNLEAICVQYPEMLKGPTGPQGFQGETGNQGANGRSQC